MSNGKILIVDDDRSIMKIFQNELKQAGYDVKTAPSGKESVKLAGKETFDIAYVDIRMPEMDGFQACQELKRVNPKIDLVLVSAVLDLASKEQLDGFWKLGGKEILQKPLGKNQLIDLSAKFMAKKAPKTELPKTANP